MTALVGVRTNNAVALACDSRACLSIPDPETGRVMAQPFDDASPKIAIIAERIVVGLAGALTHTTVDESLRALTTHPAVQAAGDDPMRVGAALVEALGDGADRALAVAFLEPSGRPRLYAISNEEFAPADEDPGDRSHRPYCGLFPFSYGFDPTALIQRLEIGRWPVGNYTSQKASDFARWSIQLFLDEALFNPAAHAELVGGPIVSAVVDRHGARWAVPPPPIVARTCGTAA